MSESEAVANEVAQSAGYHGAVMQMKRREVPVITDAGEEAAQSAGYHRCWRGSGAKRRLSQMLERKRCKAPVITVL